MEVYMESIYGKCIWFRHDVHPWGGLVKIFKSVQVYMEVYMESIYGECIW